MDREDFNILHFIRFIAIVFVKIFFFYRFFDPKLVNEVNVYVSNIYSIVLRIQALAVTV